MNVTSCSVSLRHVFFDVKLRNLDDDLNVLSQMIAK